jgi:branched-chain amino acid transport system permease protein
MATPAFRIERGTGASGIVAALAALLVLGLAIAPWWAGAANLRLLAEIFGYLALASLWNLLAGYGGLVSIGQQAFVGLGGYMLFALAIFVGVPPLAAIPLAGLIAAALAVPTALVVFRLQGAYFAIGTWVVAEAYRLAFAQISPLGGGSGMSLPATIVKEIAADRATRESLVYWTALALVLAAIGLVYGLLRSSWGLALLAIRDSETAAQSLGVDSYRTRFLIYVAAAAATGMVGALVFLQKLWISPDAAFSVNDWTAFVIFIVVIGGIGTIEGPILGTLLFFGLRQLFADLGSWYLMMLGGLAVLIMLSAPRGVWGYLAQRFDLHLLPVQRRVRLLEDRAHPVEHR